MRTCKAPQKPKNNCVSLVYELVQEERSPWVFNGYVSVVLFCDSKSDQIGFFVSPRSIHQVSKTFDGYFISKSINTDIVSGTIMTLNHDSLSPL